MTRHRPHLLLLNPRYGRNQCSSLMRHALAPSLALPLLAAATPDRWRVTFHDENLQPGEPPQSPVPDVVAITVHTAFAYRAYALARLYRSLGARVVLGGLHVTALPDEARPHADVVVAGDGVSVWPQVLAGLEDGTLRDGTVVTGSFSHPHYGTMPWPRREVLPEGAFLTQAAVIATRGCPQRCGYCYLATAGVRSPYQKRPVDDVMAEIDATGEPMVVFTDNNLMADPSYGRALCEALARRHLLWTAAVTIDVARHPELIRLMAASGCQGVFIGLETIRDESLRAQHKRTLLPSSYHQAIALLHDVGIEVNGSFVFGFDGDRPDIFDRTLDFIEEERLECATFHILTPYPGTPLFDDLERAGRILTYDWSRYDTAHAVFRPRGMTPEQLEEGYRAAYRRLYAWRSVLRRRPRSPGGPSAVMRVSAYLAMTALYKKWDFIWRLLVPLRLTHAAWHPLVTVHRQLHRRRGRGRLEAPATGSAPPAVRVAA